MDYQIPYDGCIGEFTWCEKLKREIPENWELVRLEDVTKHLTDGEHGSVSEDPKGQYWLMERVILEMARWSHLHRINGLIMRHTRESTNELVPQRGIYS